MRRIVIVLLAAFTLSGCLGGMYDERAREECDQETTARERGACHDRVDQNRRDH